MTNKVKQLRKRHKITQVQLADSLYKIKRARIADWESGRRGLPPIVWWAMVLTWDGLDLNKKNDVRRGKYHDLTL